jgi:hypothetical protein
MAGLIAMSRQGTGSTPEGSIGQHLGRGTLAFAVVTAPVLDCRPVVPGKLLRRLFCGQLGRRKWHSGASKVVARDVKHSSWVQLTSGGRMMQDPLGLIAKTDYPSDLKQDLVSTFERIMTVVLHDRQQISSDELAAVGAKVAHAILEIASTGERDLNEIYAYALPRASAALATLRWHI